MIGSAVPNALDFTIVPSLTFTFKHETSLDCVVCKVLVVREFKFYRQVHSPHQLKTKVKPGSFLQRILVVMDCEATRILQVSMSKITDSRRCRGGPLLRRNLLVSHVLNNVLTATDSAYCTYRTKVEVDMDIDGVENELVPFDKSKMTPGLMGGSVNTGNTTHTVSSAAKSNESTTEIEHIAPKSATKQSREAVCIGKSVKGDQKTGREKKPGDKYVTGSKRARPYVNEPCESHAVQNKRFKTETAIDSSVMELGYQEPMDVSGLVNVFNSSFSGLSNIPRTSSLGSNLETFQCIAPVRPVRGVFGWSQTVVEAF